MTFQEAESHSWRLADEMIEAGYDGVICYDCGTAFNARNIACDICFRPVCLDCWLRRHSREGRQCFLPDTTNEVTT